MKKVLIMKYIFSLLASVFIIFSANSFAQTYQEEQLANEYLQNGEYEKALPFFEKFYKNESKNKIYYKNYVDCLIKTQDLKEAEKVIKKQSRDFPNEQSYKIDLGQFYRDNNEPKKAKSIFDDAIKTMPPYTDKVEELAGAFLLIGETDYAIETFLKGRKTVGEVTSFNYSLAELYSIRKEYDKMTAELLGVLKVDPFEIEALKSALLTILDDDPESTLNTTFREAVLKELQKNPEDVTYSDLLIWLMLQQKNYEGAFIQAKAIDKRLKEEGLRLLQLSAICLENRKYDIAIKCFEYIIQLGPESNYYNTARADYLKTRYMMLTEDYSTPKNELLGLEAAYLTTLDENPNAPSFIQLNIELAHLQAFYLDKKTDASSRLKNILEKNLGKPEDLARAKMELADILILQGDMWEPSLLYGQIEKDYKNDVLGQEAKFKNAKLSFYRCEFDWSQAQMNALKTSTSKLIANDAIALSMLIIDNSGMDSTYDALSTFARADLYLYQNRLDLSMQCLDSLETNFSAHPINDEVKYKKAEIALKKGDYEKAVVYLNEIATNYSYDILADDALFKMGDIYERKLNNIPKAIECYQSILLDHKDSIYIVEARKRYRILKGDKVN